MSVPKVKFNDGNEIPAIGLGTYASAGGDVERAVKYAIDAGYRHIDAAFVYGNEAEVGQAVRDKIQEGVITREDMFITSKLWCNFHEPDRVEYACRKSLSLMGLDYLDLYLIHWPMGFPYKGDDVLWPKGADGSQLFSDVDYIDTWKAMEKLVPLGLVKSIGVSNFNSVQLTRLLAAAEIKPVTNQVECSPSVNQKQLIEFCKERDIVITGYCPIGRPNAKLRTPPYAFDAKVEKIGKKYHKSPVQVGLRYLYQLGTVPIPKSFNKDRIEHNIDIFDFTLTNSEMEILDSFNTGQRIVIAQAMITSRDYPFSIEF